MLVRTIVVIVIGVISLGAGFAQEVAQSGALVTKVLPVLPMFFGRRDVSSAVGERLPVPGVKAVVGEEDRHDVRGFFEAQGVQIPAEGEITYFPEAAALLVRAPKEQLKQIELALEAPICGQADLVQMNFSLVEFKTSDLSSDVRNLSYANLRAAVGESWTVIDEQAITAKSGQRAMFLAGFLKGQTNPDRAKETGTAGEQVADLPLIVAGDWGARIEAEPTVGPYGTECDINFVYRYRAKAGGHEMAYTFDVISSAKLWDDYPSVVHIASLPSTDGESKLKTYRALVLRYRVVNVGGWAIGQRGKARPNPKMSDQAPK